MKHHQKQSFIRLNLKIPMANNNYCFKQFLLLFYILIFSIVSVGQEHDSVKRKFTVSFNTYASSGKDLPFWFTTNQNGTFTSENGYYQLLKLGFKHPFAADSLKKWNFMYGTTMIVGAVNNASFQPNQYWISARHKWFNIKIGALNDSVRFAGLSHTNGNMMWSGNARPLPGITFSTNGFIPLVPTNRWFTVKGLYEENFLIDKRDMTSAMLHHKYLYGKAIINSWSFMFGLDHWVYWGGTSRTRGKTTGIEYYPRYVFGIKGGDSSSASDQVNAAGNTIGMYALEVAKNFGGNTFTFYWNHPYEDRSGLELDNMPDGIWGLHYHNKHRAALVSDILYEFMGTMDQSGTYHLRPSGVPGVFTGRGLDNYFALGAGGGGFNSSGHVFYNKMMGTPIFIPVIGADGISKGFDNTRIEMHHLGICGTIVDRLAWRSLLTWSRSHGTYSKNYHNPLDQFSWLAECQYQLTLLPVSFNLGVAGDTGARFQKRVGGNIGMKWRF